MKPLGWLFVITPFVLAVWGYLLLPRVIKNKKMDDFMQIYMLLLSLITGVIAGYILIFPIGALVFFIYPNEPHNGHYAMPMGQVFLPGALTIIIGLIVAVISLVKINRWRKSKQLS